MRGPHVRLGATAPCFSHINPYNSTINSFTFSTIVSCSTLGIAPYLFYIEKFITQFKTTESHRTRFRENGDLLPWRGSAANEKKRANVSFEVLLFSNANWTVSSDHRSINMSVASLLKMRIVPLFFVFFETIFLHAKSTRFWRPKAHFRPQSLRFRGRVLIAKTLGTRLPPVSARGPLF